uniref:Mitochondrial import inner membrane translocase subunit TIM16 n=1 Tax=Heterosigma akashiwo TaxID=2829 RepID=A0A6V1W657_HETAK|mmetsp:Transcript_10777/g.16699  ORF Transcript_10777/g.16699 Transcript_10777/m.16699 type:complete len:125 (-) Transcript_10777:264-638(-)
MAGPIGKFVAQVVVVGVSIFARAFSAAYQQAAAKAKQGGAVKEAVNTVTGKKKVSVQEALQILNISKASAKQLDAEEVQSQFKKYFENNEVSKGGSFYIQSKIYRAKEALDAEMAKQSQNKTQG